MNDVFHDLVIFLCICLLISTLAVSASAQNEPEMAAFQIGSIPATTFTDISKTAWYYTAVSYAQAVGLVSGSNGKFNPTKNITYAECLAIAVRVYEKYHGITPTDADPITGEAWYMSTVRRAEKYGILPQTKTAYTENVARELAAEIFYKALPEKEFYAEFNYSNLPDVSKENQYYRSIIALYNAGIVTGTDAIGSYKPTAMITRAEMVVILYKILLPESRTKNPNPGKLKNFDIDMDYSYFSGVRF